MAEDCDEGDADNGEPPLDGGGGGGEGQVRDHRPGSVAALVVISARHVGLSSLVAPSGNLLASHDRKVAPFSALLKKEFLFCS